jgi:hypothetical protein
VGFIVEAAVHFKDVTVPYAALDPYLEGELIDHHIRLNQGLGYLLQGEQTFGFLVPH